MADPLRDIVWPELFAGTRLVTQAHRHKDERWYHAHVYPHLSDGGHPDREQQIADGWIVLPKPETTRRRWLKWLPG
jgi:hypothetical protein